MAEHIGQLRKRIDIIEVTQGQPDNIGGYSTTQAVVATVWAEVIQSIGTEIGYTQTIYNKSPYVITIRTDSYAVTPNHLIGYNGLELNIESIQTDETRRFTIIGATGNQ